MPATRLIAAAAAALLTPAALAAQAAPPPAAPAPLAAFDGIWRGPATLTLPSGTRQLVQTERVGPALGGAIRMVEGIAYNPDGTPAGFNALGIVSPAPQGGGYEWRAYARGRTGTFAMTATATSFDWSQPAGPGGVVHFTATIADGKWHEEGWYEQGGQKLAKVYDATLTRVGATDWPAAGAVPAK